MKSKLKKQKCATYGKLVKELAKFNQTDPACIIASTLLEKAKELNDKVQVAKDYSCSVQINHESRKTCEAALKAFHALEKEYKKWKKVNIEKRGLVLKTAGDKDEPIAIVAVLAGSWSVPLECINNRWVVAMA